VRLCIYCCCEQAAKLRGCADLFRSDARLRFIDLFKNTPPDVGPESFGPGRTCGTEAGRVDECRFLVAELMDQIAILQLIADRHERV